MSLHNCLLYIAIIILFLFVLLLYRLSSKTFDITNCAVRGRTFLITGATSGIGEFCAQELYLNGGNVVLLIRNLSKGRALIDRLNRMRPVGSPTGRLSMIECDTSNLMSVRNAAIDILANHARIDCLINNAGMAASFTPQRSTDNIELTMLTNYFGHFLLTALLADRLIESAPSRVLNVSSVGHHFIGFPSFNKYNTSSLNDLDVAHLMSIPNDEYNNFHTYSVSKLSQIWHSTYLSRTKFNGTGVTINSLHPGIVNTGISADFTPWYIKPFTFIVRPFMMTQKQGAATVLYLAVSDEVRNISGQYFSDLKPKIPSMAALNLKLAQDCYDYSLKITRSRL